MTILKNDHITNAFGKLVRRIDLMLSYIEASEIIEKLHYEGYEEMDIRFALAAATIRHADHAMYKKGKKDKESTKIMQGLLDNSSKKG